jgi:hypothetical protein
MRLSTTVVPCDLSPDLPRSTPSILPWSPLSLDHTLPPGPLHLLFSLARGFSSHAMQLPSSLYLSLKQYFQPHDSIFSFAFIIWQILCSLVYYIFSPFFHSLYESRNFCLDCWLLCLLVHVRMPETYSRNSWWLRKRGDEMLPLTDVCRVMRAISITIYSCV